MQKFNSTLKKFNSNLWGHHIEVPTEVANPLIEGENRRVICYLDGKTHFQCALMPSGNGAWFININKNIRNKLKIDIGAQLEVELEKDTSEYGLPMTEELQEVLLSDELGNKLFHLLTPGKQRNLIYIAGSVKSSGKRLERALVIVNHLKLQKGGIDFRQLNIELKEANRIM